MGGKSEYQSLGGNPGKDDTPANPPRYPVPWFVAFINGEPEFRAMDGDKLVRAVKQKLCWVCGGRLGTYMCFVAGPMCGINRTSAEPPCHLECAQWSARNCPFLSTPRMVRREDEVMNNARLTEESAGIALSRNPGVAMLWITRQYQIFNDGNNKPLFQMGEPESVEWYCEGRKATRAEVMESIDSGLPALETIARQESGAMEALTRYIRRFEKWIPAEITTEETA